MLTKPRKRRKARVRAKVKGTSERPRLVVFRSNKYVYAQVIDDGSGKSLAAASGKVASEVGEEIAKKVKAKKIKELVFDRGGYKYHGKVKQLAEAAREGGLKF